MGTETVYVEMYTKTIEVKDVNLPKAIRRRYVNTMMCTKTIETKGVNLPKVTDKRYVTT